jgi:glutamate transport system permease protein
MSAGNRVLFDEPGPRTRRRIAIITVVTVVVVLAGIGWVIELFARSGQLNPAAWAEFTQWPYVRFLLDGLLQTLLCTVVSAAVAIPAGVLLALGRLSPNGLIRRLSGAYVEVFRSIPLLLLVYVFVGGLPAIGINVPIFWKLVIPIIACGSAVLAEIFRAGIRALPRGQLEAASALGLTGSQAMRKVVLPQAVRLVIPSLVTQIISLLKDSTLGYAASYPELMKSAENLTAYTHYLIQTYLVVSFIYIAINLALSQLARYLEERQGRSRNVLRGAGSRRRRRVNQEVSDLVLDAQ